MITKFTYEDTDNIRRLAVQVWERAEELNKSLRLAQAVVQALLDEIADPLKRYESSTDSLVELLSELSHRAYSNYCDYLERPGVTCNDPESDTLRDQYELLKDFSSKLNNDFLAAIFVQPVETINLENLDDLLYLIRKATIN